MDDLTDQIAKLDLKEEKKYKREKLILFKENGGKGVIKVNIDDEKISYFSKNIDFYYYNCESVDDYNWGCAYRTTQTALKTILNQAEYINLQGGNLNEKWRKIYDKLKSFDSSFENIFLKYGSRETLMNIYSDYRGNIENCLSDFQERKIAPFETDNGWFEPFLSMLVFHDNGIKGKLYLVNGFPSNAYAPETVFQITLNFNEFVFNLMNHFSGPNSSPVIIDDSYVCLNIVGIGKSEGKIYLQMADPHVKRDDPGEKGIYKIILNEDGEQLEIYDNIAKKVHFKEKNWMVFQPENIEDSLNN